MYYGFTWSRSSKKKLPDLVIYDDPHMTEKEIEERKKADKEKINTAAKQELNKRSKGSAYGGYLTIKKK